MVADELDADVDDELVADDDEPCIQRGCLVAWLLMNIRLSSLCCRTIETTIVSFPLFLI